MANNNAVTISKGKLGSLKDYPYSGGLKLDYSTAMLPVGDVVKATVTNNPYIPFYEIPKQIIIPYVIVKITPVTGTTAPTGNWSVGFNGGGSAAATTAVAYNEASPAFAGFDSLSNSVTNLTPAQVANGVVFQASWMGDPSRTRALVIRNTTTNGNAGTYNLKFEFAIGMGRISV